MSSRCEKRECCQGIPFTLTEAESVCEQYGAYMDPYVRDLMRWLIEEVKNLTTAPPCTDLKCPTWIANTELVGHRHKRRATDR